MRACLADRQSPDLIIASRSGSRHDLIAVSRSGLRAISLWAAAWATTTLLRIVSWVVKKDHRAKCNRLRRFQCIPHDVLHFIVHLAVRNTYTNVFSAVH